jgi:hypothetical protein
VRLFGSVVVAAGILLGAQAHSDGPLRETVYMSRECETGWYMESHDGMKIVMACNDDGQ